MKTTNLSFWVLVILLTSSIYLIGQQKKFKDFPKDKMRMELNLSEDQKAQIKDIRFNHEEKKIELKSELEQNKLQIKKMIGSDNFSKNDLLGLIEKSGQLKSDLEKQRVEMWLDIRNILTEEQKEIWKSRFHRIGMRDKIRDKRDEKNGFRERRSFDRDEIREMRFFD